MPFTLTLESGWGDEEDFFGSRRPEPWSCSLVGPLEAAGGPIGLKHQVTDCKEQRGENWRSHGLGKQAGRKQPQQTHCV